MGGSGDLSSVLNSRYGSDGYADADGQGAPEGPALDEVEQREQQQPTR